MLKGLFSFDKKQIVYYMMKNTVHSAEVISRKYVDNPDTGVANTEQEKFYNRFGESGVWYSTTHGEFKESDLFETCELLLGSMVNGSVTIVRDKDNANENRF